MIRKVMIVDCTFKCVRSGTINSMRWKMIPLLDAAGKE